MSRLGLGLGLGAGERHRRGFLPRRIPGLVLWLRADQATLTTGRVSAWKNLAVGAPATVAQGTATQQPTQVSGVFNGEPTLRGSTNATRLDVSSMAIPTAMTLFIVLTRTGNSSTYVVSGTAQTMGIIENFAANTLEWFNGSGADRLTFAASTSGGPHVAVVSQVNGGALTIRYDRVQTATKTAATNLIALGSIFGGAGSVINGTSGDIPEVVAYNRALSAAEISRVEKYLSGRYATP